MSTYNYEIKSTQPNIVKEENAELSPFFIVISDFHADLYTKYSEPLDSISVNSRFKHLKEVLNSLFEKAYQENMNIVINGDLFNERQKIDVRVLEMVSSVFKKYIPKFKSNQKIFLNNGNHDNVDNQPVSRSSLEFIQNLDTSGTVVFLSKVVTLFQYKNQDLVFLPYSEDTKDFKTALDEVTNQIKDDDNKKLLFGHVGVEGSNTNNSVIRLGGAYTLGNLYPDIYNFIALGHYHWRQELAKNVVYVGNTVPTSYNDEGQTKGYYILDTDKDSYTYQEVSSPAFITINLNDTEYNKEQINQMIQNNFVRILTTGKEDSKDYQDSRAQVVLESTEEYKPRLNVDPSSSASTIVSEYVNKYYDKDTEKVALEALEEALNKPLK